MAAQLSRTGTPPRAGWRGSDALLLWKETSRNGATQTAAEPNWTATLR